MKFIDWQIKIKKKYEKQLMIMNLDRLNFSI